MQVIPLSEGAFTIDRSKKFIPFNLETDDLQQRPTGSLLVEIQPFAIVTTEDVLVLDTGLGFEQDGVLQIHRNLRKAGIEPAQVTKVLMSHLHKDHAGGITERSEGYERGGAWRSSSDEALGAAAGFPGAATGIADAATGVASTAANRPLSFPNARYYVQRRELEYAFEKGPTSYITDELECLKTSPQVEFLDGDGVIDGYIKYQVTGAHCPWHQVFWIIDGGETVFFGGDVAPQLQQMKSRFVAKYDYDGKKAMELRQLWWEQGQREGWTFLFYHDVKTPTFSAR
ncbi:MBL fold metallo-hydrolase [Puia sp.]|jgi:glyoxylase-like metal-dependent hydrolase (beta-lactamase superfamily II)|uniref:MBL fold metallo-hydrolase n=1 Tax=Puia sp. TaxID=2045100 RepID=UPI002F3E91BC